MTLLSALAAGHYVVCSIESLETIENSHLGCRVRSALNGRRCGLLDCYVAWVSDTPPSDLIFAEDGTATTKLGRYLSELA